MQQTGNLQKDANGYSITFERIYNHSIDKVWDAITNPDKMTKWFTDVEWDFKAGGKITFTFQDKEKTKTYGRIVTVEPPRLLEYEWHNDEGPHEFARWELFEEGHEKTKLMLAYSRIIEDYAIGVSAGWHITLDDLGELLDGQTEFPPFGGGETEEGKAMKKVYQSLFDKKFK